MKREEVAAALAATGIHQEADFATPASGASVPLPYCVVRVDETEEGDDQGRVRFSTLSWLVAVFSKNKDFALECKIRKALAGAGALTVKHYPDGTPYETSIEFTTKERRA